LRIIADREIPEVQSAFSEFGEVELVSGRTLNAKQLGDAEILLVRSVTRVDIKLLEGTNVSHVGTATSGIDHLDTKYLRARGISYFDAAGCNARAVAEYVVACCFLHGQLTSRDPGEITVGIIGFGHVGKIVYSMLSALGLHCVINDPLLERDTHDAGFVDLDDALMSDIVSLHVPYTERGEFPTVGLISAAELARMRPRSLLINAARGGVIDEETLLSWLKSQAQARTAIDCWAGEPTVDLRLLHATTIATPHIAGHTNEARLRATTMLSAELAAKLEIDPRWRPQHKEPIELRLQPLSTLKPIEVCCDAVLRCCDPRVPTVEMRKSIDLPIERRAKEFDELRRKAASRCEFSAYRIACNRLQSDTVNALTELGFDTTMNDVTHGQ